MQRRALPGLRSTSPPLNRTYTTPPAGNVAGLTCRAGPHSALVALISDLKRAKETGATDEELKPARELQRKCQFYVDFVEAENSTGFHAPQESMRVLATAIDLCRQGQIALRDDGLYPSP